MQQTLHPQPAEKLSWLKRPELWSLMVVVVMTVATVQDYLFSLIQNTGFYLSESLLYNTIWAFLVPLTILELLLLQRIKLARIYTKAAAIALTSCLFTLLHIFIFAVFFTGVSHFIFSPSHHFLHIFNTALSNQFYVLILFYVFIPFVFLYLYRKTNGHPITEYPTTIRVKTGLKTLTLNTETIEIISAEKPYTIIETSETKLLDARSLKDFEAMLDPNLFVRVHRSAIINKNFVKEIISRQNGDYDCRMNSNKMVRFSRHYRDNWEKLLR